MLRFLKTVSSRITGRTTRRRCQGLMVVLVTVIAVSLVTLQHFYVSRISSRPAKKSSLLAQPSEAEQKERAGAALTLVQTDGSRSEEERAKSSPESKSFDKEDLAIILKKKLSEFPSEKGGWTKLNCEKTTSASGPCLNTTCPAKFSSSPEVRLKQILSTRNESKIRSLKEAMAEVTRQVSASYTYVLVTAVSANHYKEMQAMVKNVQTELMPRLTNFIFIIFDLGLTSLQRNKTEKNCRCTVLDYPFNKLPDFFSILRCYTWKPTIISSLIEKGEFLVWMDASVRWNSESPVDSIFKQCKERGLQLGFSRSGSIRIRTDPETFRFYGDEPCLYEPFGEVWATYGVYHNEPFVRQAVLDSWVSCALNRSCMCVQNHHRMLSCSRAKFPRRTGVCHRFDQSALGIILGKLYGDRINLIRLSKGIIALRGKTADWFTK